MKVTYTQINFTKEVVGYTVEQVVNTMKARYPELNAANTHYYDQESDTLSFRVPTGTKN